MLCIFLFTLFKKDVYDFKFILGGPIKLRIEWKKANEAMPTPEYTENDNKSMHK